MTNLNTISHANFRAFSQSSRTPDIISKKQEIFDSLNDFYNIEPKTILCIGFSSFIFLDHTAKLFITDLSEEMKEYVRFKGIDFIDVEDLEKITDRFDVVIAADEYFTYAASDEDQRHLVQKLSGLTKSYILTTLKDYKNQDYKDRECSMPLLVKNQQQTSVFVETNEWHTLDRNAYTSNLFEICNNSELISYGSFARRVMYFKQLAKFSIDAGASQFLVHKNLMYKSLFKKNYEHVITIKF